MIRGARHPESDRRKGALSANADRGSETTSSQASTLRASAAIWRLVLRVMDHRRSAFDGVLRRMGSSDRAALAVSLTAFAAAAGEHPDDSWSP